MTLDQFQTRVHYLLEGDTDVPTSSDAEYTLRTELLSDAIDMWNAEEGILWRELWTTLADAADGGKTVLTATTDYDCPSDFRFPGGFVKVITSGQTDYITVVSAQEAQTYDNLSEKACYFTGNDKTGYDLHFLYQPTVGSTIDYPYYKQPFKPSSSSHIIEMSEPSFAVYYVLSALHEANGAGDRANLALAKANAKLTGMKTKNEMATYFQVNAVPDRDYSVGVVGFGR